MRSHTNDMLNYISTMARHLKDFSTESIILVMLLELEFCEKLDGFEYLRTAIYLFHEDPAQMITKGLYPAVAKQHGRNIGGKAVERAIRNAIDIAWRNQSDLWRVYFPSGNKPSNGDFIAKLSKYIELWKECCEVYHRQSDEEVAYGKR